MGVMQFFDAIILGAIQGITEFLPVSSTGHLVLAEHFLHISQEKYGLPFDAALHIGTLLALIWFFKAKWLKLLRAGFDLLKDRKIVSSDQRLLLFILVGTIPGIVFGLLLEHKIESVFRSPLLIGVALIVFSGVLYYIEKVARSRRQLDEMTMVDSVVVGLAQSLALFPGVSRSGITMGTGMWRGFSRHVAAQFAFLLSAPIIAGAGALQILKLLVLSVHGQLIGADSTFFIIGIISAAIFGYLTITYFLKYISKHSLMIFIYYRIALGATVILLALAHRL